MSLLLRLMALVGLPAWLVPVVLAGLIAGGMGWSYVKGRADARANCREAALAAEIARLQRDIAAQAAADAAEAAETASLTAERDRLQQEVNSYESQLALAPAESRCLLTGDDLRRLPAGPGKAPAR